MLGTGLIRGRVGRGIAAATGLLLGLLACAVSPAWAVPSPPDGRAYELVSPVDAGGSDASTFDVPSSLFDGVQQPFIFSADGGDSAVFRLNATPPGDVDNLGKLDLYRADRTAAGWVTTYAGPPGSLFPTILSESLPLLATDDLSRLFFSAFGGNVDPADTDPPTGRFPDLLRRDPDGTFTRVSKGDRQEPVFTESPFPKMGGISADGSVVVFLTDRQITTAFDPVQVVPLYQRVGGQTTLVSIDDSGGPVSGSFRGISGDGSVIVFGRGAFTGDEVLFVRRGASVTDRVSPADVHFEGMSADGSLLAVSSSAALTPDDTDTSRDLYAYDTEGGGFTRLSVGLGALGDGNSDACSQAYGLNASRCDIAVVKVSQDASRTYFISPETQASEGTADAPNLYVSDGVSTEFVATLSPSDATTVNEGDLLAVNGGYDRAARLTPDGLTFLFETLAPLASEDTDAQRDVYVHRPGSTTPLACASCAPAGSPDAVDARLQSTIDPQNPFFLRRQVSGLNVTDDGSLVFFETAEGLLPRDINGNVDVYQFDTGSGEIALISTGLAPADSHYHGNSGDGRDVFFLTPEALVSGDQNGTALRLYDARVGGGFPQPPPPPVCAPEDCHGAIATPPAALVPGSHDFVGPGNESGDAKNCDKLERKAKQLKKEAKRADGERAERLQRKAKMVKRKAKKCNRQAGA